MVIMMIELSNTDVRVAGTLYLEALGSSDFLSLVRRDKCWHVTLKQVAPASFHILYSTLLPNQCYKTYAVTKRHQITQARMNT
jgi:hypothetical protein